MVGMEPDGTIRQIARQQHGVIGDRQAEAAGTDFRRIARRLGSGALELVGNRAYVMAGAPMSDKARAMAAVLDVRGDSYLSHSSAAWLWGIPGFDVDPIHVARRFEGTRRSSDMARIHNLRGVPDTHLGEVDGIPVASPVLTCFQVAAMGNFWRTERAVDNVLAMGIARAAAFHHLLSALAQRGRNGIRIMRTITAARPPGYRPPESGNERRFQWICQRHDIPVERQVNIGNEDQFVTRVDFRDLDYPWLVFRIQSARWHGALSHARDDADQIDRLAGFTVIDIWDRDLWQDADAVAETIRAARFAAYDHSVGRNRR